MLAEIDAHAASIFFMMFWLENPYPLHPSLEHSQRTQSMTVAGGNFWQPRTHHNPDEVLRAMIARRWTSSDQ